MPGSPPARLARALEAAARDLSARADAFATAPDVARALGGGGIAVNRRALFSAARQALDGAPPTSWLALTDPAGTLQAWWGEAPATLAAPGSGPISVEWSATTATLVYRRALGGSAFSGFVSCARTLPVEAPEFGQALGLSGAALSWEPVAGSGPALLSSSDGTTLMGARPAPFQPEQRPERVPALLLVAAATAYLIATALEGWRVGMALALAFLGLAAATASGRRALADPELFLLAAGPGLLPVAAGWAKRVPPILSRAVALTGGYALLALAFAVSGRLDVPDLGATAGDIAPKLLRLAALAAVVCASLVVTACGPGAGLAGRGWMPMAFLATWACIMAGLAFVEPWPGYPAAVALAAAVCFELWRRAVGAPGREPFGAMRLTIGTASLLVLLVAPWHEQRRAAEATRVASAIRLPDPERTSLTAVSEAQRAADRVTRMDLDRVLPASTSRTDLSDLAYRIWKDGEESGSETPLIAYEVFDGNGRSVGSFSLLPQALARGGLPPRPLSIDHRHLVAVMSRDAPLSANGRPWGTVRIEVADWPAWDPLPATIEVYRRLVLGGSTRLRRGAGDRPRPVLASYAPDGSSRGEGPELPEAVRARLPVPASGPRPVHLSFRGEDLRGELRAAPEGFQLVAVPGPDFFGRLLTAALVLPALGLLALVAAVLLAWRLAASPSALRAGLVPASARTFRGRLVALFVVGVMIPLVTLTFFLRRQIETRSARDTLDHARTALKTAQRVLDDYMLSAAVGRDRLGLLDDALLAWVSNAVGYDLSVYGRDARLLATSRHDLYSAGLLAQRVPGPTYVAIGLSGADQHVGARPVAGSRFEEVTTALGAVPGVPGLRSPGLLSLLLLPQRRVAEAETAQLTAAVSAFSLLIFLVSAAIAGRLAVRVARPVADLVEGTRAVARGDFAPRVPEPPDEELKELVRAFLSMSRSLKDQTDALSLEKERLATLLAHLTAGVVAVGEGGRVLLANPAAAALGGGRAGGATLEEVFPGEAMREVRRLLADPGAARAPAEVEPRPGERWHIVTVPLPLGGEGTRMAVIEDISDVVRSNRLAAWAEMARIIAHEIKNPLTPIRLSVEHLREVWRRRSPDFERVLDECVANVLAQTEELRRSAAEFADYARLPRPEVKPVDLESLLKEAVAAWRGAPNVRFAVDVDHGLAAQGDERLLTRVFSNLIGNAVEALGPGGGAVVLTARKHAGRVVVSVEDDGPGVPAALLPRLFDPYFSAKSGGTGLGLAIVKKIVEEHGGSIAASNRPPHGFRVEFSLRC